MPLREMLMSMRWGLTEGSMSACLRKSLPAWSTCSKCELQRPTVRANGICLANADDRQLTLACAGRR